MEIEILKVKNVNIALVESDEILIVDGQSFLDLLMSVCYNENCSCIIINKNAICEDFFMLSSGIAGDVLQKTSNYNLKFAIVGNFSKYTSKSLKDFIYESNKSGQVLFIENIDDAVNKFAGNL